MEPQLLMSFHCFVYYARNNSGSRSSPVERSFLQLLTRTIAMQHDASLQTTALLPGNASLLLSRLLLRPRTSMYLSWALHRTTALHPRYAR